MKICFFFFCDSLSLNSVHMFASKLMKMILIKILAPNLVNDYVLHGNQWQIKMIKWQKIWTGSTDLLSSKLTRRQRKEIKLVGDEVDIISNLNIERAAQLKIYSPATRGTVFCRGSILFTISAFALFISDPQLCWFFFKLCMKSCRISLSPRKAKSV